MTNVQEKISAGPPSARDEELLARLAEMYPGAESELNFTNEYELIVSVILSAQCTDKKVNEVTPGLFKRFKDFEALAGARVPAIEKIIRPVNYYRTKAKHLIGMAQQVHALGKLPRTHDELIELSGVGRKTANVVLAELGAANAIAVDTHVFRVSQRLGIASGKNVLQIEHALMERFKPEHWRSLHHLLILHGRRTCVAQRPRCLSCGVAQLCPARKTFVDSGAARE